MMVGSNDLERSKTFYDASRRARQKRGQAPTTRAALVYGHNGSMFMVTKPIDGEPATHGNGSTIGFAFDTPEEVDAWHQRGHRRRRHRDRGPAGHRVERASASLYLAYLRDPDGNKLCGLHRPPAMTLETLSEVTSHGGRAGRLSPRLRRDRHRHDLFGVRAAACARGGEAAGAVVSVGADLHPRQRHREGRVSRACAEHGVIFVAPDTSPRGDGRARRSRGVGFRAGRGLLRRCDRGAVGAPLSHVDLSSTDELPALVAEHFPIDMARQGITGHSMGGHGALTMALRHPGRFRAVVGLRADRRAGAGAVGRKGAAATISATTAQAWRAHDAVALIEDGARVAELLVDLGDADPFLEKQLQARAARGRLRRRGDPPDAADASRATTTAIISSRPSWPTMCAGTPSG